MSADSCRKNNMRVRDHIIWCFSKKARSSRQISLYWLYLTRATFSYKLKYFHSFQWLLAHWGACVCVSWQEPGQIIWWPCCGLIRTSKLGEILWALSEFQKSFTCRVGALISTPDIGKRLWRESQSFCCGGGGGGGGAAHPPSKEKTHAVRLKFYDPGSTVFFYMHCFMRLGVHVSPRRKLTYPFSIPWKAQVTGRGYLGCSETGCVLFFVVLQRLATTWAVFFIFLGVFFFKPRLED